MTRFRPPERPGSKYITPEGARRLREELDQLWRIERPQVTQAVAEAAAQGDRSENAEYTYGKRRLREIDRRVRFLRKRLDGMVVVEQPPIGSAARVFSAHGCRSRATAGEVDRYRIVGPDEFDREPGYISMDAPLARALLGKPLDDEVKVELPGAIAAHLHDQWASATSDRAPPAATDRGSTRSTSRHRAALRGGPRSRAPADCGRR